MNADRDITALLRAVTSGDKPAVDLLMASVYDELRALAQHHLQEERGDHTLQATALVHEVYLRLVGQRKVAELDRGHFMAIAAMMIRRILVDHARHKAKIKRGGDRDRISLDDADAELTTPGHQLDPIALDDALNELALRDARRAKVVELRYFAGMTMPEVAQLLDVSLRTVEGDWALARAWLRMRLMEGGDATHRAAT